MKILDNCRTRRRNHRKYHRNMLQLSSKGSDPMEERRVRISDIAEELGLSTATVSNVLHGKTKKISDETVKRVQALLEERQYIPSMAGILLAQNSSRIIGVVVNDHEKYEGHVLEDVFIASSLNHLSAEIEKQGRFMMVKKATDADDIIRFASMWNVDGLVMIGFCNQDYMDLRNHMRIPFVVYDGFCDNPERICNIKIDDYDGGVQMGQHFKECGHEHVLFIADNDICVDKDRYLGFCVGMGKSNSSACGKCGTFENRCCNDLRNTGIEFMMIPMQKEMRWEFYRNNIKKFQEVTAVFAASDYYAIDLICFLREHGIRVPEDISVAGFDDTPMCTMTSPTLTTVRQDGALRARLAMEKLQELKEKKETETTVVLPVKLVVRASTKRI